MLLFNFVLASQARPGTRVYIILLTLLPISSNLLRVLTCYTITRRVRLDVKRKIITIRDAGVTTFRTVFDSDRNNRFGADSRGYDFDDIVLDFTLVGNLTNTTAGNGGNIFFCEIPKKKKNLVLRRSFV